MIAAKDVSELLEETSIFCNRPHQLIAAQITPLISSEKAQTIEAKGDHKLLQWTSISCTKGRPYDARKDVLKMH